MSQSLHIKPLLAALMAAKEPMQLRDLVQALRLIPGTITRLLTKLVRQGLLERRGRAYVVTEAGRDHVIGAPAKPFDAEADRLEELAFWTWVDLAARGRSLQGVE